MKLIATEFLSLDGIMEAPGGEPGYVHTGWVMDAMGPQAMQFKFEEVLEAEAHLLGRVTYESFAGAWPHKPASSPTRSTACPNTSSRRR